MLSSPHISIHDRLERTIYTRENVGKLAVAIVGCGALGSEVARLLGLLGLRQVLLIDSDCVEVTNFTHSPYLRGESALGRPKVEVAAEKLSTHFPETVWTQLACEIADVGFQRLRECSLIFSCTDNTLARVETAYAAYRLQIPMIDAGLKGHAFWSGRVAWFPASRSTACYLCQLGEVRRAELLSLSLASSQSCASLSPDDPILPSTPTMASIIAGVQVDLGLRLTLATRQEPISMEAHAWELSLPLPDTTWRSFTIPQSRDCPWHDSDSSLILTSLPMDVPLRESITQHADEEQVPVLELDWPRCIQARCNTCQHLWSPMVRLATLRRRMHCPSCGGVLLHSVETLSSMTDKDTLARHTPRELGLPEDHLFTLRSRRQV